MPRRASELVSSLPIEVAAGLLAIGFLVASSLGWTVLRDTMQRRAVAVALTGAQPDIAPALLRRYGCTGCHTIRGIPGADGKVAAPLSDLRARVYIGGVLPNTAENLIAWIADPPRYSPRTAMPVTGISEDEARIVASFLYAE